MPEAESPSQSQARASHDTNADANGTGSSHFTGTGGQDGSGDDARRDIADYLAATLGAAQGWVGVCVGIGPHRTTSGKIRFRHWIEGCGAWPDEADEVLALLLRNSPSLDTYICPYVLAGPEREKGGAVARTLAHCDGDDGVDLANAKALPGVFAAGSGTQGHAHVYAGLTRSVPPHQHEALCKGLGHYLGAKDPKFSDNDVLRPPGTWNFKPRADDKGAPPLPVTWLIRPTGVRVDPEELAELVGVELTDAPPAPVPKAKRRNSSGGGGGGVLGEVAPFGLWHHPRVQWALAKVSGDRSADTMRVVRACLGSGLTAANARWAVRQRDDLAWRLDQRTDDDVARCWRVCLEES